MNYKSIRCYLMTKRVLFLIQQKSISCTRWEGLWFIMMIVFFLLWLRAAAPGPQRRNNYTIHPGSNVFSGRTQNKGFSSLARKFKTINFITLRYLQTCIQRSVEAIIQFIPDQMYSQGTKIARYWFLGRSFNLQNDLFKSFEIK